MATSNKSSVRSVVLQVTLGKKDQLFVCANKEQAQRWAYAIAVRNWSKSCGEMPTNRKAMLDAFYGKDTSNRFVIFQSATLSTDYISAQVKSADTKMAGSKARQASTSVGRTRSR